MKNKQTRREFGATAITAIAASVLPAPYVWAAEKKYDSGATDTEIKIGQTVPHSGPGSLYGVLGRVGEAYFQMLNEKDGINGRKVKFLTMDDAYSAPKCVEATRRLVEQEEVLALFGSLGTAPQTAVHKYLNSKGVPQLLLNTGASKWNDPKNNKWTMAGLPLYPTEARILAKHVVSVKPNAKVGILYQNDDFGRDFLGPFKKVLADAGGTAKVIMEQTYDLTDPTHRFPAHQSRRSPVPTCSTTSRPARRRRSRSARWPSSAGSRCNCCRRDRPDVRSSMPPASRTRPASSRSAMPRRPGRGAGRRIPDVMAFEELRKKYLPNVDPDNTIAYAGYGQVVTMAEILRRCGDDLTRANVLKQASNAQRLPFAVLPRRHHLQLHARRLHADEDALHLDLRRQGLANFRPAGHGVIERSCVDLPRPARGERGSLDWLGLAEIRPHPDRTGRCFASPRRSDLSPQAGWGEQIPDRFQLGTVQRAPRRIRRGGLALGRAAPHPSRFFG